MKQEMPKETFNLLLSVISVFFFSFSRSNSCRFFIADVIVQAECLSVDPYMRNKAKILPLGSTMDGGQVAR